MSRRNPDRYTDFIKAVVPNAEVDNGVLKSGRLRAYGGLQILSKAVDGSELVIGGYASPQVMDREKHVITKEALARDLPRFMAEPEYRNANLLHSNVQVGKVIPVWVDPATGKRYETKVDDIGLFAVVKIRTDAARPNICKKVEADIRSGKLSSFSISADAPYESRRYECSNGTCFWVIDAVELYEITICETPVNQDAKFTMLTKAFDELGEFAAYMWCQDGSCPVTPRQAGTALRKTFGATDFSTRRNIGTVDDSRSRRVGNAAARSEQISDDPQNPLDLDFPWPARDAGKQPRPDMSFDEAFDSLMEDPGGNGLINRADKSRLPHNEQTGYLQTPGDHGPDSTVKPDPEPEYGGGSTVKLSTAEHFHLALKGDLGQLSVDEAVRLAELNDTLSKDNEASGFPPDSGYGQVITGQDHPNRPVTQGRPKNAKLQPPITGTPSIMRSLDAVLSRTAQILMVAEPIASQLHKMRVELASGDWPLSWDTEPRLFRDSGTWLVKGTGTPASLLLSALRKAAMEQGDRRLVLGLSLLSARLDQIEPLTPRLAMAQAVRLSAQMPERGSILDKATPKPEVALKRVRDGVARLVRDPENRVKVPPRLLASLDTILEEAEGAIDGLQLGLTIGLAEDTKLSPRDPQVKYRPAETPTDRCGVCRHFRDNGTCELVMGTVKPEMVCNLFAAGEPEHEIIQNAGAGNTYHDVQRTDALLDSVAKAQMPQQQTQDEAEADDGRPAMAKGHDGAMIAWYPTSGTARQFAHDGGEPADELHVTVVYLGKVAKLSPEQRQAILSIVAQHVKASPPIEGEITRIEHFEPSEHSDGKVPVVALIEAPDLRIFRDKLVHAIGQAGVEIPNDFPDYKPHMTLKYDLPGMDDMQERGIPEIQSTPIMVDRLVVVFGGEKQSFSFDAGGLTQIHGKDPGAFKRRTLKAGDEDAVAYAALFQRMWSRGFRDPSYQLVIRKAGGEILELD